MPIEALITNCQTTIHDALKQYLPAPTEAPQSFNQALHYVLLSGGKRLRPLLVYATGRAVGVSSEILTPLACSVEIIHCYSLVHDDLPAMDNDDLRRGQPTCHRAFNEATAILVGDALQALAFEILAHHESSELTAAQQLKMIAVLSKACGCSGMVKGQALDMQSNAEHITVDSLEALHRYKTGKLIEASVLLGALAQEKLPKEQFQCLQSYAKAIGLAFQIQDDILDVMSDTETLGKTQGKDYKQHKATYPALMGLENAQAKAKALTENALKHITGFDHKADHLRLIADYIIQRIF